jgi:hypothetical protein
LAVKVSRQGAAQRRPLPDEYGKWNSAFQAVYRALPGKRLAAAEPCRDHQILRKKTVSKYTLSASEPVSDRQPKAFHAPRSSSRDDAVDLGIAPPSAPEGALRG